MPAYITAIGTANPPHAIPQSKVVDFMIKAHGLNDAEARNLRILYRASGISNRYTTIPDYANSKPIFFPDNDQLTPFPDMKFRADWYRQHAISLSLQAVHACVTSSYNFSQITHLVTVSCTGMHAPGLDIDLVSQLQLPANTERTSINFMGCYAAFNAMKLASHVVSSNPKAKVLIVCTELCTLHFQKEKTDDNLLANALFGDGAAAMLIESSPADTSIELVQFDCTLIPSAINEMAWSIGNFGFEMRLSAYVPDALREGIAPMLQQWKNQSDDSFDFYAIHPGGKKILEVVEHELGIDKETNRWAHDVLRRYGNMSSPTVLFVLNELFKAIKKGDNDKSLLALAFGPGLTLESLIGKIRVK
jgi:predicted naringenin-chalcone synthase